MQKPTIEQRRQRAAAVITTGSTSTRREHPADHMNTPYRVGKRIVKFLLKSYPPPPGALCLDPCRGQGDGSFYKYLPDPKEWCEITRGRDFFGYVGPTPYWIMSNMPWGTGLLSDFLRKSVATGAENIAFLMPVRAGLGSRNRIAITKDAGYLLRTIIAIPMHSIHFKGYSQRYHHELSVIHWQRGYRGDVRYVDFNFGAKRPIAEGPSQ